MLVEMKSVDMKLIDVPFGRSAVTLGSEKQKEKERSESVLQ